VLLIIAPEVIILIGAMIMMVIIGVFELLMHVLGIEHDREDEERKKKQ
jgi:hypothetical protein